MAILTLALGTVSLTAHAATLAVGPGKSFPDIQSAINAASDGDTITVYPSTYSAAGDFNLDPGTKNLVIQSAGGASVTILDYTGANSGNQEHAIEYHGGQTSASVFQGFTIKNGFFNGGGGVTIVDSSPTIKQCVFIGNTSSLFGGAIDIVTNGGTNSPTITQCTFISNVAGDFSANSGFGGAIECEQAGSGSTTVAITNCVFDSNSASYDGGAIDIDSADAASPAVTVVNCSFTKNNASAFVAPNVVGIIPPASSGSQPGVVDLFGGVLTLTNCILYADAAPTEVSTLDPGTTATFSDIQGGFAGTGDINQNPKYASTGGTPTSDNLNLLVNSPAKNAGTTGANVPTIDLIGLARDAQPDLGAYEVQIPTANNQSVSTNKNTAKAITLTGSDANTPARSLTYTVTNAPTHGSLSGTAPNLTYTPTAGYTGPDSFKFKVNNGDFDSTLATVSITVVQVTLAPTANSQSVTTSQNTAKAITLTGSDPNSPALPLTYIVTSSPTHGSLSGTAPNLTYTPTAGYTGPDSFQFKVNNGSFDSNIATVSITVSATVQAPTANSQSVSTNQNTAKAITLTGSDPNSPALPLTYIVTSSPTHGSLSGTAPNLTYTPTAGYTGPDSFQFKVNNGSLDSNTATVSITVVATPVATNVTGQVTVTRGGYRYNRSTGHFFQSVQLTNTGAAITGPISLVLDSLSGAQLVNKTGVTSATSPAGSPYLNTNGLAVSASETVVLEFSSQPQSYTPRVLAGSGNR